MIRNFLNISLAASLLMTPLLSADVYTGGGSGFWDSIGAANVQDNIKGFQEYRGANGERVYSFGGALTIKRELPNYPLWWHAQAPEISASCAGVSFKGMFGSIINFEELERQFSEAGESVAFGILVGIIYSLPSIGEIFSRLNAWSNRIQQMLADSCKSGIDLGKSIGKAGASWANDQANSLNGGDPESWYNKMGKDFGGIGDKIDGILDCAETASDWIADGSCEDAKDITKNAMSQSYFGTPSILGSAAFNYYLKNNHNFPIVSKENKLKYYSPSNIALTTGAGDFYKDMAFVSLITAVTGDSILDAESFKIVGDAMDDMFAQGADADKTKRKGAIKSLMKATADAKYMCEGHIGDSHAMKQIAQYLIYGSGGVVTPDSLNTDINSSEPLTDQIGGTSISKDILSKLYLPNIAVLEVKKSPTSHSFYATTAYGDVVDGNQFNDNIKAVIQNYKGVYQIALAAKDYYLFGDESAKAKVTFNLFNDETQKFMAKVYRNTRDTSAKMRLESIFVNFAIYHMAQAIRTQVSTTLHEYQSRIWEHAPVDKKSTELMGNGTPSRFISCREGTIKRFRQFNLALDKVISEFLHDFLGGVSSPHALYAEFENQNRKNIKAALESLKRK